MTHKGCSATPASLTRRTFVQDLAWASAAYIAFSAFPRGAQAFSEPRLRPAVVSFYMDRPYLDPTGTGKPYFMPRGMRSAEPLAHLSEEEFRNAQYYV